MKSRAFLLKSIDTTDRRPVSTYFQLKVDKVRTI